MPRTAKSRIVRPDWLTLLSAILIVPSFAPWDYSFLIWFCLIPWFIALSRARDTSHAFWQGLWFSFFMGIFGFYWVASVLHEFGNLPWPVAIVGLLLFAFGGQPQFLGFAAVWKYFQPGLDSESADFWTPRKKMSFALALAIAYTGIDWLVPKLFVDTLGHSLYKDAYLRQAADLGGASFLTFVIFLVNFTLWRMIHGIRTRQEPSYWPTFRSFAPQIGITAALFLFLWSYGVIRNKQLKEFMSKPLSTVQAGVIQGNIGDVDKISAERGVRGARQKVIETFFGLSDKALAMKPAPDFLVWPETSYPAVFRKPETTDELAREQSVEKFVRDRGIQLLFGGYDSLDGKDFNAFFFLTPKPEKNVPVTATLQGEGTTETDLQVYRKNILLLFGEYIPGTEQIKFIKERFPQIGNFGRGRGPDVLKIFPKNKSLEPVLTGPIICYEALFPSYVIQSARKGSQLITNITNDSWFGPHGEPELHLSLTIFRSIETRLPQLRSTNTGISALILPDGTIAAKTGIGVPDIMNVSIPIIEPMPTLMKAWGDWFGPTALAVGFFGLGVFAFALRARSLGPELPDQVTS